MKNQISVAAATTADRKAWETLYRGYAGFYQVEMTDSILDSVWSWIFDQREPFYCLLARNNAGDILGLMHFRAMASPLRGATVGFLDDLFVNPDSRGEGVVDALFEALDEQRRLLGWPFVRWITAEDNYRARSVYERVSKRTQWVTYQLDG